MSLLDTFRERRLIPGQDPWVVAHDGWLLLVQRAARDRRLVIRRFRDLERMDRAEEKVIWSPNGSGDHSRQLWAPELHHLDGRWYVYYSASDGRSANHRNYALVADDPFGPYEDVGRIADPSHDVWAIDLTVFTHQGQLYAVWSGWDGPDDGFPQNLYIAPMSDPTTICGERRCISRPEHDWEMSVAPVNEGPEAITNVSTGQLFILYAADASWTQAYKTGLLEWTGGDVLDPSSWRKLPRPFFTGGGHASVFDTKSGPYFIYHRKLSSDPGWADREIRWAPLGWDADGRPVVRQGATTAGSTRLPEGMGRVA
jgi:GH43 family beta-xylosidase